MIETIAIYATVFLAGMIVGYADASRIWKQAIIRGLSRKIV